MTRRSYGTGRLYTRADKNGRETYYGTWWVQGRRVKRRLGVKRATGEASGLTQAHAEAEMRRQMAEVQPEPATARAMTVRDLSTSYRGHLEALGRKRTTIASVESVQRVWIDRVLGDRPAVGVTVTDVEDLMRSMRKAGVGTKSVRNYVGTLSAMYRYAKHPRRGWVSVNPCDALELPPVETHAEIRSLTVDEANTLIDAAVDGDYQAVDRALYVVAAMTGLRQGELIALRWQDVDWTAQRIRVRRNHVLGEFDTPKSRRGSRSVPITARVVKELDALYKVSRWTGDERLVFADPATGDVLLRGALMRRYRQALKAAKLEPTHRFHDLRHTFGTAMAAAGVPMRTLQEWMGHRDISTTQRYADYAPNPHEVDMVEAAFSGARGSVRGSNLSESENTSDDVDAAVMRDVA